MAILRSALVTAVLWGACWTAFPAGAQSFPNDAAYRPLRCARGPMDDPTGDVPQALGSQDLVGSAARPVALRAADDNFLFVRIRLGASPASGSGLKAGAWGILWDTNDDLRSFEVAAIVQGASLRLSRNRKVERAGLPSDAPDDPGIADYPVVPLGQSVRVVEGQETFLDLAIRWDDLGQVGLDRGSSVRTWVATSKEGSTALDGDLACEDEGEGRLRDAFPRLDVLSPAEDADDDGYSNAYETVAGRDPNDATSHPETAPGASRLEGGGGCVSSGSGPLMPAWPFALCALVALRIHRRSV